MSSGNPTRYKKTKAARRKNAYVYFLNKYRDDIGSLPASGKRALYANCNFSIAKALRKESLFECLPYIIRAFLWKPGLKPLLLFLPLPVLVFYKGDLH